MILRTRLGPILKRAAIVSSGSKCLRFSMRRTVSSGSALRRESGAIVTCACFCGGPRLEEDNFLSRKLAISPSTSSAKKVSTGVCLDLHAALRISSKSGINPTRTRILKVTSFTNRSSRPWQQSWPVAARQARCLCRCARREFQHAEPMHSHRG